MVKNLPVVQETRVQALGQEDPLKKGMATPPAFLPGEFHGQRGLAVQGVAKGQTCLGDNAFTRCVLNYFFIIT